MWKKADNSTKTVRSDIMEKFFTVAQVIAPIFVALFLGVLAKKKQLLTAENVQGL